MTPTDRISPEEIAAFQRDGAVVLRAKFTDHWLAELRDGIDADLATPTDNLTRHTKDPQAPAYFEDFWAWNKIPQFRDFVFNSPRSVYGIASWITSSGMLKFAVTD